VFFPLKVKNQKIFLEPRKKYNAMTFSIHILLFHLVYSLVFIYGAALIFVILKFKGIPVDRWLNNFLSKTTDAYKRAATTNPTDHISTALSSCQNITNPSARSLELEGRSNNRSLLESQ